MALEYISSVVRLLFRDPREFLAKVAGRLGASKPPFEALGAATPLGEADHAISYAHGFGVKYPAVYCATKDLATARALARMFHSAVLVTLDRSLVTDKVHFLGRNSPERIDSVIVPGGDSEGYLNVLRAVVQRDETVPVLVDDTNFEMCGSDLPITPQSDTDLYLYNHFTEHFGIKDPIQVRLEAYNAGTLVHRSLRFMRANEVLRFKPEDLQVPADSENAFVHVEVRHPVLTRGRHQRFRLTADVRLGKSIATLHSSHEFTPPAHYHAEVMVPRGAGETMVLTVPDYDNQVDGPGREARIKLRFRAGKNRFKPPYMNNSLSQTIDLRAMVPGDTNERSLVQYTYHSRGGGFWFRQTRRSDGSLSLAANHESSTPWDCQIIKPTTTAERKALADAEAQGILFLPLALPILSGDIGLDAAFDLAHCMPRIQTVRVLWFDKNGILQGEGSWPYPRSSAHVRAVDIDSVQASTCEGGLVMFAPEWKASGLPPSRMAIVSNLHVIDVKSEDCDVTELQDSWRNVAGYLPEYPRFMMPPCTNVMRTSLLMRWAENTEERMQILAVAGAGDLKFTGAGRIEIRCYRPNGEFLNVTKSISAFTHRVWDLAALFPTLGDFAPDGFGYVRILSGEIDLTAYAITRCREKGAISLQHFWGY